MEQLPYFTTPEQDHVLIERLRANDRTAFRILHDRYAQVLYEFIFSKTQDDDASRDLVQEIFLALWSNRAQVVIEKSTVGYLFGMAKFKSINHNRWMRVRQAHEEHLIRILSRDVDDSVQDNIDVEHVMQVVERVLSTRSLREQYAFRMSRFERLPIEDIATQMSISRRTVENYISNILTILRPLLTNAKDGIRKNKNAKKKHKRKAPF